MLPPTIFHAKLKETDLKTTNIVWPDTLESHRVAFLEWERIRGYADTSLKSYKCSLASFFRFLSSQGIDEISRVNRENIHAYALSLVKFNYATQTRHVLLKALRRFFKYLSITRKIEINPCLDLLLPKLEDHLPRTILNASEVILMLNAPDTRQHRGIRDKAILELFYTTGIRLEEMARLTLYDVDWSNGFVYVKQGKGAKDRVVPMGSKAAQCLQEYIEIVRLSWIRDGKNIAEQALWLSARKPHRPIKSQIIQVMVRQYARAMGMEKAVTPHVWRHSCATHLLSNGANLMHVKQLLGHSSLKTTQIYTRVSINELKSAHRSAHPRSCL